MSTSQLGVDFEDFHDQCVGGEREGLVLSLKNQCKKWL